MTRTMKTRGFLSKLSPSILAALEGAAVRSTYSNRQQIQSRGDKQLDFALIRSGKIRFGTTGRNGAFVFTGLLLPGDAFGEMAIFGPGARVLDGFAVGPTVVDRVSGAKLKALVVEMPELGLALLSLLARRLIIALDHIDDLMRQPLVVRIARYLMFMYDNGSGESRIEIGQSDLAEATAASRVSVSKCLKELAQLGLVETGYGYLDLPDPVLMRRWLQNIEEVDRLGT